MQMVDTKEDLNLARRADMGSTCGRMEMCTLGTGHSVQNLVMASLKMHRAQYSMQGNGKMATVPIPTYQIAGSRT